MAGCGPCPGVNLSDPEVTLDLLYNDEGVAVPRPLTEMAAKRGVVAAINGDFFYRQGSYYAPVGPMVQEGRLVTSPGADGSMGVFALNSAGRIEFGPWRGEGYVYHPGGSPSAWPGSTSLAPTTLAYPLHSGLGQTQPGYTLRCCHPAGDGCPGSPGFGNGEQEIPEGLCPGGRQCRRRLLPDSAPW